MQHKLYVGNLPYSFGNQDLEEQFLDFGAVQSLSLIHI